MTDSTCDLSEVARLKYGVVVVPLHVWLGGMSYLDRVDFDSGGFYKRFRAAGQGAQSSQPSVGEFASVYSDLLKTHDAVVSIHISARLSGTVQTASIAAESVDPLRVRLVDSRHVSVGLGLVVQAAGEAILADEDLERGGGGRGSCRRGHPVYGALPSLEVAVEGAPERARRPPRRAHRTQAADRLRRRGRGPHRRRATRLLPGAASRGRPGGPVRRRRSCASRHRSCRRPGGHPGCTHNNAFAPCLVVTRRCRYWRQERSSRRTSGWAPSRSAYTASQSR